MRRLTVTKAHASPGADGERGAVAIIVAVLMVALLGFASLAIDVGMLYAERAQLQNGADAAALSVAQTCARNLNGPACASPSPMAKTFADSNAHDGLSNVQSVALNRSAGTVTVVTGAMESGGAANSVSLFFAGALGIPTAEVGARASAVWGSPQAGRTPFPLAFSVCQVQNRVDGALQRLQSHGTGANSSCNYGPNGAPVAGGYGWIVQDSGVCGGSVDILVAEGGSATGNDGPTNCDPTMQRWATELTAGRDVIVLLPVFNQVTGTGSGASYKLIAFAAFSVKGWKFAGSDLTPKSFRNTALHAGTLECTGNCRGIIGRFVKYVSLEDGYRLGPLDAFGSAVVRMNG
jgi:Putative Flp pilus-assembly TadE/G-like